MNPIRSIQRTPTLIVGSGVAGLTTALNAGECTVATTGRLGASGATPWSQGGIAAAVDASDSPASHAADTIKVSDGLTDPGVVELVTAGGVDAIEWLQSLGAEFDSGPDGLELGREAGHSHRRIVKSNGDSIGAALSATLNQAVASSPDIQVLEECEVVSLALDPDQERVRGALVQSTDRPDDLVLVLAAEVVLATGGYSYLWEKTTNPAGSIGSGIYLAGSVGAELTDLEFVQFHPTALDLEQSGRLPLLTEAIRGEGAQLVNFEGERYMAGVHPDAELAPRDVVARANYQELVSGNRPMLDPTHSIGGGFSKRFPGVAAIASDHGFDPHVEALPVTPAAHYCMGGVVTDELGRTSIAGLRAVGEVSRSGLHGANRLASNSLLEGLVMGRHIGQDLRANTAPEATPESFRVVEFGTAETETSLEGSLRQEMWRNVGLIRNKGDLESASTSIEDLETKATSHRFKVMGYVAKLVAQQALLRKVNQGAHHRSDATDDAKNLTSVITAPIVLESIPI